MIRSTYRGTFKDSEDESIISNADRIRIAKENREAKVAHEKMIQELGEREYAKSMQ